VVNCNAPVPLHPLCRAADSPLTANPALLPFTDACTSARGHSGEERSLLPSVKPGHRARGGNVVPRTPPRTRCVMTAIEPGWERSLLAGAAAVFAARATPLATLSSSIRVSPIPVAATPPLSWLSPWTRPQRAHVRTRACVHAPVHAFA
jgi:hypothetical protein